MKVILISPFLIDPEQDIKLLIKNRIDPGPEGHRGLFMNGGEPMAKGKYHRWLEPEGLLLIEGWARDGLIDEQIAHNMGINVGTLYEWKKKYAKIDEALKKGKEVIDYQVENALLKNALRGDTTAQIFWLKNRKPNAWREKQNIEVSKPIDDTIKELEDYFSE